MGLRVNLSQGNSAWGQSPPARPINIEAEQALLGAILHNNDAYYRVADTVCPEHFSEGLHERIFVLCAEAIRKGQRATPITIRGGLPEDLKVGDFPNPTAYLAHLLTINPTIINAPDYARVIRDAFLRRQIMDIAAEASELASSATADIPPDEIISALSGRVLSIGGQSEAMALLPLSEAAGRAIRISEGGGNIGVKTGLVDLDRKTGGLMRGSLYIAAGRPGMGKSAFVVHVCLGIAMTPGRNGETYGAALFSLEMPNEQVAARAVTDLAFRNTEQGVAYADMLRGYLKREHRPAIDRAYEQLSSLPVAINDKPMLTLSELEIAARKAKQEFDRKGIELGVIGVDYLQLMRPSDRYSGNRVQEVTELSAGLKALAKRLDVPVLALSQLSRKVEERADKRPSLADLRESGSIEQDADVVMFLYRDAYYLENKPDRNADEEALLMATQNLLEINVAKQRNGPIGTVKVFIDLASSAIRDLPA